MRKLKVGEIFQNRYKILSELGAGGMGTVYQAEQIDAGRIVALKLLRNEEMSQDSLDRFYREFKLLSKLSHPNIMTIYGLALDDDNIPYAVCEFIEGESLRPVLNRDGALPWQRVAKIVIQIASAMQYAHSEHVIHRDLKPDNVMVLQKPEPDTIKLVDFGLSKAMFDTDDLQKLTLTGQLIGTANYMSPELTKTKASERSDIYALACIAYELLSGQQLFDADAAIGVIFKHASEDPSPRMTVIRTRVPEGIIKVLLKMLEKNPENRMASMSEVQNAWQLLLDDPSKSIAYTPATAKTGSFSRIAFAFAIMILLLSSGFAIYFWMKSQVKQSQLAATQHIPSVLPRQGAAMSHLLAQEDELSQRIELAKKWLDDFAKDPKCSTFDKMQVIEPLADAYEKKRQFDKAAECWDELEHLLPHLRDTKTERLFKFRMLHDLVMHDIEVGNWKNAKAYAHVIFDHCLKEQDATVLKDAAFGAAMALLQVGDFEYVLESFRVFQSKYSEMFEADANVRSSFTLLYGDAYVVAGKEEEALEKYVSTILQDASQAKQLSFIELKNVSRIPGLLNFKQFHNEMDLGLRVAAISRLRYLNYKLAQTYFASVIKSGILNQKEVIERFKRLDQNTGKNRIVKSEAWIVYSQLAMELENKEYAVICAKESVKACELWKHGDTNYARSCAACLAAQAVSAMFSGNVKDAMKFESEFHSLTKSDEFAGKKWLVDIQLRMHLALAKYALQAKQIDFAKSCLEEVDAYRHTVRNSKNPFDTFTAIQMAECFHDLVSLEPSKAHEKSEALYWSISSQCFPNMITVDAVGKDDTYNCARAYMKALLTCGKVDIANRLLSSKVVEDDRAGVARAALEMEMGRYYLAQGQLDRARELLLEADKRINHCQEWYDKRTVRLPLFLPVKLMLLALKNK